MMAPRLVPMIHVPDVRAAADWYQSIGFTLMRWHGDDEDHPEAWDWACLRIGETELMLDEGGRPSDAHRREVDLYIQLGPPANGNGVDALHDELKDRVDVVEPPHDAFHGSRELIIRDLNRFWITFGQPIPGWNPPG